ncbi:MAG: cold shock domain-containing protein [Acidocella sp.]|nr:cold shock domain-containing protein [Acidocella sp.]
METVQEDKTNQINAVTGIVKWFNPGKGYGFIAPDAGGNDIFVHISAVQHAGLRKLNEGERVRFMLEQREGRVAAVGIERAN